MPDQIELMPSSHWVGAAVKVLTEHLPPPTVLLIVAAGEKAFVVNWLGSGVTRGIPHAYTVSELHEVYARIVQIARRWSRPRG